MNAHTTIQDTMPYTYKLGDFTIFTPPWGVDHKLPTWFKTKWLSFLLDPASAQTSGALRVGNARCCLGWAAECFPQVQWTTTTKCYYNCAIDRTYVYHDLCSGERHLVKSCATITDLIANEEIRRVFLQSLLRSAEHNRPGKMYSRVEALLSGANDTGTPFPEIAQFVEVYL